MAKDIGDIDLVRTTDLTPEDIDCARANVGLFARDDEERIMFLQMLGIDHAV